MQESRIPFQKDKYFVWMCAFVTLYNNGVACLSLLYGMSNPVEQWLSARLSVGILQAHMKTHILLIIFF